jgi:HAD superfamily hydrolase (TIGR01509 family)
MDALNAISEAKNLVIDFDGVIANSEEFQLAVWRELFTERRLPLDRLSLQAIAGFPDRRALAGLCPGLPTAFYEELVKEKKRRCIERVAEVQPVPGARQFLESVSGVKDLFICSGSPIATIERFLDWNFPSIRFHSIVGKGDYAHPKPCPDPYLALLERAKIRPQETVVIEDSQPGVESAQAAGLRVIRLDRYATTQSGAPSVPSVDILAGWRGRTSGAILV